MRFRTAILQTGRTATGIKVPDEVVEALGRGKRPPVSVTIKGYTYRSTVASMGGDSMVGVSAEVRERAGVAGGDIVDVDMVLDEAPREVGVPDDLGSALDAAPDARQFFERLSYSRKQWYVLSVTGAKTAETRARRVMKAVDMLREGRLP